jgi:hypothetical protein
MFDDSVAEHGGRQDMGLGPFPYLQFSRWWLGFLASSSDL